MKLTTNLLLIALVISISACGNNEPSCGIYRCPISPTQVEREVYSCVKMGMKPEFILNPLGVVFVKCVQ
jgi:hypothetical protein